MSDAAVGPESIGLAISFMSISFFLISIFNFLFVGGRYYVV